nr:hypothetical protein BgiMline_034831 [Biomphalaria glabrata]
MLARRARSNTEERSAGTVAQSPPVELLREARATSKRTAVPRSPSSSPPPPEARPEGRATRSSGANRRRETDRSALPMESARGEAQCDGAHRRWVRGIPTCAAAPGRAPR